MNVLDRGAEAVLYVTDNSVVKKRVEKAYRVPFIDKRLRKSRTRREAKVLSKLAVLPEVYVPSVTDMDDVDMTVTMEFIDGEKLATVFEDVQHIQLSKKLGAQVAAMHNAGIIHGDLTTSNMLLKEGNIYIIDFGLSFFSDKVEHKAVDLHLLRQALESKHYAVWEACYDAFITTYQTHSTDGKAILTRLESVEKRGRYKKRAERDAKRKR